MAIGVQSPARVQTALIGKVAAIPALVVPSTTALFMVSMVEPGTETPPDPIVNGLPLSVNAGLLGKARE